MEARNSDECIGGHHLTSVDDDIPDSDTVNGGPDGPLSASQQRCESESSTSSSSCSSSSTSSSEEEVTEEPLPFTETDRYRQWRKHVRDLYQCSVLVDTIWTTRTVEFLPYLLRDQNRSNDIATQTLLTGTLRPPPPPGEKPLQDYVQLIDLTLPSTARLLDGLNIDQDTFEIGGFGVAAERFGISVSRRMYHDGGVMAARYMPANPLLIATNSSNGSSYIFDWSMISTTKEPNDIARPTCPCPPHLPKEDANEEMKTRYNKRLQEIKTATRKQEVWDRHRGKGQHILTLSGNKDVAYGLDWSVSIEGDVCAGSNGVVNVWSIGTMSKTAPRTVDPAWTMDFDGVPVNDVKFSPLSLNTMIITLNDGGICKADMRMHTVAEGNNLLECNGLCDEQLFSGVLPSVKAATIPISIGLSPLNENIMAIGGENGCLYLFDQRNLSTPFLSTVQHNGDIGSISWSPFTEGHLVTGGQDGFCSLLDVKSNTLLFRHAGHTLPVTDVHWSEQECFTGQIVTCDANAVTVWKPRNAFWVP
eukprot:Tbor_TRINITY_DN658_c0_g1::TRINITY_DN658_c0_g1_i1::g.1534::m.1534/K10752/RBBP4, HAT2, CAF1, MIS16; histone-binding protein RBBP4